MSGRVVNADSKPVADATVYAVEQGPSLLIDTGRFQFQTTTNSRGYFDFGETLKHEIYEIYVQIKSFRHVAACRVKRSQRARCYAPSRL